MSPPRVDFYLLESLAPNAVELMACRLAAKVYALKRQAFIYCHDQEHAKLLDQLLWTFEEGSFVPHLLETDHSSMNVAQGSLKETSGDVPILMGWQDPLVKSKDVMINLTDHIPAISFQFNRVIEIVSNDPEAKAQSRERYRDYRLKGCELHLHRLE